MQGIFSLFKKVFNIDQHNFWLVFGYSSLWDKRVSYWFLNSSIKELNFVWRNLNWLKNCKDLSLQCKICIHDFYPELVVWYPSWIADIANNCFVNNVIRHYILNSSIKHINFIIYTGICKTSFPWELIYLTSNVIKVCFFIMPYLPLIRRGIIIFLID